MARMGKQPHKCPVCGKFTFPGKVSFEICDVCGWQDDLVDENDPDDMTINPMSLEEYRKAYKSGWRPDGLD